jgi:phosphocarrier protein
MRHAKLHIVNPLGLHARAASKLVDVAKNFASDVKVVNAGGIEADAKRIMNLLLLGAPVGSEVELFVQGEDENEALAALIRAHRRGLS